MDPVPNGLDDEDRLLLLQLGLDGLGEEALAEELGLQVDEEEELKEEEEELQVDEEEELERELKEEELRERIRQAKVQAVELKRAGKKEAALRKMRDIKAMEGEMLELRKEEVLEEVEEEDFRQEEEARKEAQERLKEYSRRALEFRKEKNRVLAEKLVLEIRKIKEIIEEIEVSPAKVAALPPRLSDRPEFDICQKETQRESIEEEPASRNSTEIVKDSSNPRKTEFQMIFCRLKEQIEMVDSEIAQLKDQVTGRQVTKTSAMGVKESLKNLTQQRQELIQNLDRVKSAFKDGLPPPEYHIEKTVVAQEITFPEIKSGELRVFLKRGVNFVPPPGWKEVTCFAVLEFSYGQNDIQKKQSQTIDGTRSPEFNFEAFFRLPPIQKIGRGFKFAKVIVKVFCPRLLFFPILLGETELRIGAMYDTKSELSQNCVLKLNGKTVGSVEMNVRLRNPIKGKDIQNIEKETFVIDSFPTQVAKLKSSKDPVDEETSRTSQSSSNLPNALPLEVDSDDWNDPNRLELFKSMDVLLSEKESLENAITKVKVGKKEVPSTITDRYNDVTLLILSLVRKLTFCSRQIQMLISRCVI